MNNVNESVRKIYYDENDTYFISKIDNSLDKHEIKLVNFAFGKNNVSNYYDVFNIYNYIKFVIILILIWIGIVDIRKRNV